MLFVVAFISIIFLGIAFLLNANNARYLLSGYNTLSAEERAKVDIQSYLRFFKGFHIFLALTVFTGTMLLSFLDENWASKFMIIFPLLAYIVFIFKSSRYYSGNKTKTYVSVSVVTVITILIVVFLFNDYKSSELRLSGDELLIKGSFGTKVSKSDIETVALVKEYPPISWKTYGFAAGDFTKGDFKLKDGRSAKMYINKKVTPTIHLKARGGDIYYNSEELKMDSLYQAILRWKKE